MSRDERIIRKIDSLDAKRSLKISDIESLENQLSSLSNDNKADYVFSVLSKYVFPAISIATGGFELMHTSKIDSSVIDRRVSNPNINWTNYYNNTGSVIKALPPEVAPAWYENPWTGFTLQQGVNIACAINLGLTAAEYSGAKSFVEKVKKGAWLVFHGGAALTSKIFTWGKNGVSSKEVSVPETYNGEPNLLIGKIAFDSYLNGIIASGVALGIEGGLAYHNLTKLFSSLADDNKVNSLENKIINANRAVSKINDDISNFFDEAINEFSLTDYTTNNNTKKTLGKLLTIRYPDLKDLTTSSEDIPSIKDYVDNNSINVTDNNGNVVATPARDVFMNYVNSIKENGVLVFPNASSDAELLNKLYLLTTFEGDLDPSMEISGVMPSSFVDTLNVIKEKLYPGVVAPVPIYEQVLKGLKEHLMP